MTRSKSGEVAGGVVLAGLVATAVAFVPLDAVALSFAMDEETPGEYLLSKAKDGAKSAAGKVVSGLAENLASAALSYVGLGSLSAVFGFGGGEEDPFLVHVDTIVSEINDSTQTIVDHINDRWEAETYQSLSVAVAGLNDFRNLSLTQRVDNRGVCFDLVRAFDQVLGRYAADIVQNNQVDLLHEYMLLADTSIMLAVEYGRLVTYYDQTDILRRSLVANLGRNVSVEDFVNEHMDADQKTDLADSLREMRRGMIRSRLTGDAGPLNMLVTVGVVNVMGSVTPADYFSYFETRNVWLEYYYQPNPYELLAPGELMSADQNVLDNSSPICTASTCELFFDWDTDKKNWLASWMMGDYISGVRQFEATNIAMVTHALAEMARVYGPARVIVNKWWAAGEYGYARPYTEVDDHIDSFVMDFYGERGGYDIEAFLEQATDGSALLADRSYENDFWTPEAVWERVKAGGSKRLSGAAQWKTRALVDLALAHGVNGAIDVFESRSDHDPLSTTPLSVSDVVDSTTFEPLTPAGARKKAKGEFAAKFVAAM